MFHEVLMPLASPKPHLVPCRIPTAPLSTVKVLADAKLNSSPQDSLEPPVTSYDPAILASAIDAIVTIPKQCSLDKAKNNRLKTNSSLFKMFKNSQNILIINKDLNEFTEERHQETSEWNKKENQVIKIEFNKVMNTTFKVNLKLKVNKNKTSEKLQG